MKTFILPIVNDAPQWLLIAVLIIIGVLYFSRHTREIFQSLSPAYRRYKREKMDLELLKLRLEIEAIKKAHDLAGDAAKAQDLSWSQSSVQPPTLRTHSWSRRKPLILFLVGLVAALVALSAWGYVAKSNDVSGFGYRAWLEVGVFLSGAFIGAYSAVFIPNDGLDELGGALIFATIGSLLGLMITASVLSALQSIF